jgi:hypothetical protein
VLRCLLPCCFSLRCGLFCSVVCCWAVLQKGTRSVLCSYGALSYLLHSYNCLQSSRNAREGSVLVLDPQIAKDFTLPRKSGPIIIAPEAHQHAAPTHTEPASHLLPDSNNDQAMRPRVLANVNFATMQGRAVPDLNSSASQRSADETQAEPGPGSYCLPAWLEVRTFQICTKNRCIQIAWAIYIPPPACMLP